MNTKPLSRGACVPMGDRPAQQGRLDADQAGWPCFVPRAQDRVRTLWGLRKHFTHGERPGQREEGEEAGGGGNGHAVLAGGRAAF